MKEKLYIEELSDDAKEEISILYSLGVDIQDIEYLIQVKYKESLN